MTALLLAAAALPVVGLALTLLHAYLGDRHARWSYLAMLRRRPR